jgi:pimeloyl-ACP methyl ester carboxylesterase
MTLNPADLGLISALARHRRVIRFDMPGIGASAGRPPRVSPPAPLRSASTTGLRDTSTARRSMSGVLCRHIALSVALSLAKTN